MVKSKYTEMQSFLHNKETKYTNARLFAVIFLLQTRNDYLKYMKEVEYISNARLHRDPFYIYIYIDMFDYQIKI